MQCLINITLTIIDPGWCCSESWLESSQDVFDLWVTPVQNDIAWLPEHDVADCLRELTPAEKMQRPAMIEDYVFEKWAVGFNFMPVPQCNVYGFNTDPITFEIQGAGIEGTFRKFIPEILAAFDPLISQIPTHSAQWHDESKVRTLSALTLWEYGEAHPLDFRNWDTYLKFLGLAAFPALIGETTP